MKRILLLLLLCATPGQGQAQDTLRICTYNVLNFPGDTAQDRIIHFRTIIAAIDPDILAIQEVLSAEASKTFLDQVMNYQSNDYLEAEFIDGPFSDNALYYKKGAIKLTQNSRINTPFRDIAKYGFELNSVPFHIYSMHLTSSPVPEMVEKRHKEVLQLLGEISGQNNLVVGDFNIYNADEPAWKALMSVGLRDPLNKTGNWHHNIDFAPYHTQSPRKIDLGKGSFGGMDDRFDFILTSQKILKKSANIKLVKGSYITFGNDGQHYNKAINENENAFGEEIADALYYASDHIPVYADFIIKNKTAIGRIEEAPYTFGLQQNYPNPFNPETTIKFTLQNSGYVKLTIFDQLGRHIATLINGQRNKGKHSIIFDAKELHSGTYYYKLETLKQQEVKQMTLLR